MFAVIRKTRWGGFKRGSMIVCSLLVSCCLSSTGWGSKIVYPWRATTAIVKTNETFEVWFDADSGQNLNSVQLKSEYKTVTAVITSTNTTTWDYDQMSGNSCNRKYTVKVPYGTPADRYDLILNTSTGNKTSPAAVKVINEYKTSYYIVHMTDTHIWQSGYNPTNIAREVAAVIKMANILDPEMIINTGDTYYPNANSDTVDSQRVTNMMNGWVVGGSEIIGFNDAYAAIFMVPGNHDTTEKNYENEVNLATPARDWNERFGLQSHNFKYGNGRFMGLNNSWCSDALTNASTYKWQLDAAKSWLNSAGDGNFRVTYAHVPQQGVTTMYHEFDSVGSAPTLMLAGHTHNQDNNPMRVNGSTASIVYVGDTPRDMNGQGPFNLFKVNASAGTFEAVGNTRADNQVLQAKANYSSDKLTLVYSKANNGTFTNNTATITNKFSFPISSARIRFVMQRGTYTNTAGTIKQQFDGTLSGANVTVVDVSVDVSSISSKAVTINKTTSSQVTVPNVVNLTESSAKSSITGAGLTVSGVSTNFHATIAAGIIYSQTPAGGTQVAAGSSVALAVSKGPSNQPPYFTSSPFAMADATTGSAYSQSISSKAVDPEGGTKTFSKAAGPTWLSISSSGAATGTPGTADVGTNSFSVQVTDNGGLSASAIMTIKVNRAITMPVVNFINPTSLTVQAGSTLYVNVGATDPDGIDRVRLYKDGVELSRSEGDAPYEWNGAGQTDLELQNLQTGSFVLKAKAVDMVGDFTEKSITITVVGGLPSVGSIITLKAVNGKYVTANYSTNNTLIANKTTVTDFERFKVVNATNCIALQCMGNSKFVSINSTNGTKPMLANRTTIGSFEKFNLIQSGTNMAIQSVLTMNYASAVSNGTAPLQAVQTYIGAYEKFTWKVE